MFAINQAVRVTEPIDYGAGTSHWVGVIGVVKSARERSCDVLIDGDLVWFFNRELSPVLTDAQVDGRV